ncbi:DUF6044 family protein [Niallia sp. BSM11]|uniref:DUF6044 family protein n=1 Tax=Niallia sp. BSM11 TaxID=3391576 RepID=UPI0039851611
MINVTEKNKQEKIFLAVALLIVFLWVLPYFILNGQAHMRMHDNLDSNLGWYEVLKNSGNMFAPVNTPMEQIMNGEFSRDTYYSEYYGMLFLFNILPPVVAYGLSQAITRFFAFLGMYLLLKKHVFKNSNPYLITIGAALTFALTPYWPSGMLSILGMPLALWSFLNIRKGERNWKNYLVLTLLPVFSTFVIGFFYFLTFVGLLWLYDLFKTKKWNFVFLLSIVYMLAIYLVIDYRLVISMIAPASSELTNRDVFYQSKLDIFQTLRLLVKNYVISHNQDRTISQFIIMPLTILCLIWVLMKKQAKDNRLFLFLHILNLVLSTWYAFWFFEGWQPLKERVSLLTSFNFGRFHYLRPMIIYVLFALSLKMIWDKGGRLKYVVYALIAAQLFVLIPNNEEIKYKNQPSYAQYFAEDEFKEIKEYINKPLDSFRVVSIGMHPNVAQYNGFYTLDSYSNIYPLSYKEEFRKIIEPELNKNKGLREYYDYWGGRCYIFVDELGKKYQFSKHSKKSIKNLSLNTNQLQKMGGQYILSALPIENAKDNNLTFEKSFETKTGYWKIYLYEVNG